RLGVAQLFSKERLARRRIVGELAEGERMYAALRQVELDLVLVGRLHALQRERFDPHGLHCTVFGGQARREPWTILACFQVTRDPTGGRDRRTRTTMSTAASPNVARIPAGDFLMGAADAEEDERPVHRVFVGEFFIGRFPVTNDEYARFVRAAGHPSPAIRALPLIAAGGRDAMFKELGAPYVWQQNEPPTRHSSHPVVLVQYENATAY